MEPNEYDVGQSINLDALFLTGTTVGTISVNQTVVYVRDPSGLTLTPGSPILIQKAGYASGELRTTIVSVAGQAITVADPARISAALVEVGSPATPTSVTCKVKLPDGSETSVSVSTIATGRYRAVFVPVTDGDHYYRFTGIGSAAADGWKKFTVRPERVP